MSNFALGRYIPYDSFLHRLDPRAKFFCLMVLIVAVFLPFPTWSMTFAMEGVVFLLVAVLLWISRMSLRQLWNSLKSLWFMVVFLLVVYVLVPPANPSWPAFTLWGYPIYWDSILESAKIFLRLALMIMISLILTATTKPLDLTAALEWYMAPLKLLGFPTHIVAMTITLALRFIPTILEDVDRIMKAQSSRGVDFEHGHIGAKFKAIISLIVPLFVSSFIRSDELANAMECRGYDPTLKRTRYRLLRFGWGDLANVVVVSILLGLFIYVSVTSFDAFKTFWGLTLR
jgi:energy-coupling factor transport system permease protein